MRGARAGKSTTISRRLQLENQALGSHGPELGCQTFPSNFLSKEFLPTFAVSFVVAFFLCILCENEQTFQMGKKSCSASCSAVW